MNECHQEKIQKHRDFLIENTRFDDLWQTLTNPLSGNQHELIFTDRMIEDILDPDNDCGNECQNERFYDLIVTSPHPDAFNILKNALSSSGHNDLAKLLLEDKLVCTTVDMSVPSKAHLALPPLLEKVKVSRSKSLSMWAAVGRHYSSYVVQSMPRGYVLLINMRFIMNPLTDERKGSEVDVKNLKSLFTQLNHEIVEYQDLTLNETEEAIENFSHMEELAEVDSVLVFVMSHGRDPSKRKPGDPPLKSPGRESVDIELDDNKYINSNEIVDKINQSSTIRPNTPRMFFFNVCRGSNTDWGPNGRSVAYNSSDHIADTSTEVDAKPFTSFDPTPSNLTKPISSPNLNRPHASSNGNGSEVNYSSIEISPAGPSGSSISGLHLPEFSLSENSSNGLEINPIEMAPNGPHLPQNGSSGSLSGGAELQFSLNENGFSGPQSPQFSQNENGFNGMEAHSIEIAPNGPSVPQNGSLQNGFSGAHPPQLHPYENGINDPEVSSNEITPSGPHLPQNGFSGSHLPQVGPPNGNGPHVSNQQTLPENNIRSSSNESLVNENTLANKNKANGNNKLNGHKAKGDIKSNGEANGYNSHNNPLIINHHHDSEHKSQHGNIPSDMNHAQSNGFVFYSVEEPGVLHIHKGYAPTLPRLEPTNYSTTCCCIPLSNKKDKSLARCAVWFARLFKCSMPCFQTEDATDRGVRFSTIHETEETTGSSYLPNGERQTEPTVSSNPGGSQLATEPIDIPTNPLTAEESSEGRSYSPKGSATSSGSIRNKINGVFHTISNTIHLPYRSHSRVKLTGDIFMAFSTVDGYNSKRHPSRGSWFITFICQVFAESAKDTDLLSMMEEVDRRMRERCDERYGTQMYVKKTEGFSKKFFFNVDIVE